MRLIVARAERSRTYDARKTNERAQNRPENASIPWTYVLQKKKKKN